VKQTLAARDLLRTSKARPKLELFLTDLSEHFDTLARRFLRADFGKVQRVSL
jgi:glutamate racemase